MGRCAAHAVQAAGLSRSLFAPSAVCLQLFAFNCSPSTVRLQLFAFNCLPSTNTTHTAQVSLAHPAAGANGHGGASCRARLHRFAASLLTGPVFGYGAQVRPLVDANVDLVLRPLLLSDASGYGSGDATNFLCALAGPLVAVNPPGPESFTSGESERDSFFNTLADPARTHHVLRPCSFPLAPAACFFSLSVSTIDPFMRQAVFVAAVRGDCEGRPNGDHISHATVWSTLKYIYLHSSDIEQRHSSLYSLAFTASATLLQDTLDFVYTEERSRPYACPAGGSPGCRFDDMLPLLRAAAFNVKAGGLAVAIKFASDNFLSPPPPNSASVAPPPMSRVVKTLSEMVWDQQSQAQVQQLVDSYVDAQARTPNSTLASLEGSMSVIADNVEWKLSVGNAVCEWLVSGQSS